MNHKLWSWSKYCVVDMVSNAHGHNTNATSKHRKIAGWMRVQAWGGRTYLTVKIAHDIPSICTDKLCSTFGGRHWQKASVGKSDQIVIHVHFLGLPTSSSDGVVTHVDLVCLEDCSHRSTGCALPNACAPVRAISSSHNFIGHCNTSDFVSVTHPLECQSSPLLRQDSSSTAPRQLH